MALDGLRFPMIVKHSDSYSSIGMSRASRVTDAASLREQVARMVSSYGRALVEEFVEGREFTVLVADPPAGSTEPRSFLPVEFLFPPGETFKHFDLKWVDHAEGDFVPVADPGLDRALRDASIRFFSGISGDGYGRCDLRVDVRGEVHMLEINPNCGIFYPLDQPGSADAALQLDPSGHQGFVDHILDAALRRQARGRRVWRLRHDPPRGYGMVAALPLRAGDLIERHEERPHVLATRAHVERHWDEARRRWFRQYAWPLGDETFVLWDESPEDWRPVDHSCDPNAWLSGLDVVARRDIAAGEPISLDYATFCGPDMEPFDCHCGAVACRRSIRGTDCLRPGLLDRYGDHVSDAVRRLRRDAGGASRRT
jgi:D-alanine-D-alanine ligase